MKMKIFWTAFLGLSVLLIGIWLNEIVAELTQASGKKLLLGRTLIWGSLAAGFTMWLARGTLAKILSRLADHAERRQASPLSRKTAASSLERVMTGFFLAVCAALTVLAFFDPGTFMDMFREDGPFETGSAILYLASSLACILLAVRASGHRSLRIWLVLLAALFIFVGGEEISWGQRIIGLDTPESLATINVQNELTLHNIYSNSLFVYSGLAVTAMLLFVAPLLHALNPCARRIFDAFEIPVAPFSCAILYAVAFVAYMAVGLRLGTPTPLPINWSSHLPHFDDEKLEFMISALFAVFAFSNWRLVIGQERMSKKTAILSRS